MYGTRLVVADSDIFHRRNLIALLEAAGYTVVGEAEDAGSALQLVYQHEPDLLLYEYGLSGRAFIDVVGLLDEQRVLPVVLMVNDERRAVEAAGRGGVYGILLRPVNETMLVPVLEVAFANFRRLQQLEREIKDLRHQLEVRKAVEKAKGLLMQHRSMREEEAHRYLQRLSMEKGRPIEVMARSVIRYFSAMGGNEGEKR